MVLRDYRVEPILLPGETVAMWKERILVPRMSLTLQFKDKVPLRLVKRMPLA